MSSPRRLIEDLFHRVADMPDAERGAYLDENCPDPSVRSEVENLLRHDAGDAPRTLTAGPVADLRAALASGAGPAHIGRYRVIRRLGEGGMGTVYEAEQEQPQRRVAVKVIRVGLGSADTVRLFLKEAEALGRLQHPGIAHIYEAGLAADGLPYLAMELVAGLPLQDYVRQHSLTARAKLDLVARVCDAVQHAHDRGVVHRDLKPGNVFVTPAGEPKVLDFGVARVSDPAYLTTAGTHTARLVGTLAYMSPEQASGDDRDLGPPADVYSLGVVLYELLAGALPIDLRKMSLPEAALAVRERVPRRLEAVDRAFRGDIGVIVGRATEKDPAARYRSAADLAADLRRHLRHEPILARPPSAVYLLRKFARRNKGLVGGAATVVAALVVGLIATAVVAVREADLRRVADDRADRESIARRDAEGHRRAARKTAYVANLRLAQRDWEDGQVGHMIELLDQATDGRDGDEDLRGFEWDYLWRLGNPDVRVLRGHASEIRDASYAPDGRRLATTGMDGTVRVWEEGSGVPVLTLKAAGVRFMSVRFSPDGRRLAAAGLDAGVRVWDAATGELRWSDQDLPDQEIRVVAFSPDERRIACADAKAVTLWDAETGRVIKSRPVSGANFTAVAYCLGGRRIAAASGGGAVHVFDGELADEVLHLKTPGGWLAALATSADGGTIVAGGEGLAVHQWDAETGEARPPLRGHADWVTGLAFRPGGQLVSASRDGTVREWDPRTGKELRVRKGHAGWVMGVAANPTGRDIASVSRDLTVRVWPEGGVVPPVVEHAGHPSSLSSVAVAPDGRTAVGSMNSTVQVSSPDGVPLALLAGHKDAVTSVAFRPGGRELASASRDGTVRVWDLDTGEVRHVLGGHKGWVSGAAWSPDGRALVSCDDAGVVRVWNVGAGVARTMQSRGKVLRCAAFSPDGARVAAGGADRAVGVWDVATGEQVAELRHTDIVLGVAFSPDSRLIASAGMDQHARLWDARTGAEVAVLKGHSNAVAGVAFSPDGRRLATASFDRTVRVWETAEGKEVLTLRGHGERVWAVAFSADGRRLVSACQDKILRVWDAPPR